MSASIMWRPLANGTHIPMGTPSAFITALGIPRTFTGKDYDFLNGVRAGNPSWDEAIGEILDAITKHGEIEVFAEY